MLVSIIIEIMFIFTDTKHMLAILRTRKFSQLESRKMVDNMVRVMSSIPEWFANLDTLDPKISAVLDTG